ncbi:succinyl-diaminopimelate desuccinylase [Shewanella submarina]|uniref:Succinyl-diaminopimelate desuccinylase n=1 Tax=Shewanella submarina TaxID=2016376 RepID=A0ABV7GAX8_9GAMM|nr:succinyl-diaminopimelate desuccinylase [Shewanella submarina]
MPQLSTNSISYKALSDHKAVRYTQSLVGIPSVTPEDGGCQDWVNEKLAALGFSIDCWRVEGVTNTLAVLGQGAKRLAFAGHTDVVSPGDIRRWRHNPFDAVINEGLLMGRGAVDMKSGLAVMLAALGSHVEQYGVPSALQYQFLMTSDEEGEAEFGTREIVEKLKLRDLVPDYCLIAEPTAARSSGDTIRIGRRGAISCRVRFSGKQGHVAYPGDTCNAVDLAAEAIAVLTSLPWDSGCDDFPGTSLQVTWINSGAFVDNLVPGECELCFNVRFSHRYSVNEIKQTIELALFERLRGRQDTLWQLEWDRYCEPYFTPAGLDDSLIAKVERAVLSETGKYPCLSSSGGTSDGRFLASDRTQVVELGLPNATIHQVNEHARLEDIVSLYQIYRKLLLEFSGVYED